MGPTFALAVAKAMWAVAESTVEITSHVLYFLFSLPAQERSNFNVS